MVSKTSCGSLLKQIHDEMEKRGNNSLRSQGLTIAQLGILLVLYDKENHCLPLKQIERELHVAQSTAAGIVTRLEQKGLVDGYESPDDHRVKMVRMTQAGLDCCEEADRHMAEAENDILSALTDEERSIFQTLLQKVRNSLE